MLIQCLENIGAGLLHACISSSKNNQKRIFAYGVCEVDELYIPKQHELTSSTSHETASLEQHESTNSNSPPTSSDDDSDVSSTWSEDYYSPDDGDRQSDVEIIFQEECEQNVSNKTGPFFICLRLDRALENLGLDESACVNDCGKN
jgi:hypothetical protein